MIRTMKTCKQCGTERTDEQFYPRWAICKMCVSANRKRKYHGGHKMHSDPTFLARKDETKKCSKCQEVKPITDFYVQKNRPDGLTARCRSCFYLYQKKWVSKNRERSNEIIRECNRKLKLEVIGHYGQICVCCGETRIEFLNLDHKNNDGAAHRKQEDIAQGIQFYRWVRRNAYPDFLQVLCWNCNCGKMVNGGVCPHERERARLEELTEQALHPTSPAPGHAEGCACHRCRIFVEERKAS